MLAIVGPATPVVKPARVQDSYTDTSTVEIISTVAPAAPTVRVTRTVAPAKPAPLIAPPGALAGFALWAAERMALTKGITTVDTPASDLTAQNKRSGLPKGVNSPYPLAPTEAEDALADRLAFEADGGDPDEFRPGWQGDHYEPSTSDLWGDRGFTIAADGDLLEPADAFPDATPRELLMLAFDFNEGQHQGFVRYAREAGFAAGLAGQMAERPASIPSRFDAAFLLGHYEGTEERVWREAELADFFAKCDVEHDLWLEEMENRSRMGWPTPACWCPALEA